MNSKEMNRCGWCGDDPLYQEYHDCEWGVANKDPQHLFAMLNLEGAQAGLSWITVLRKRQGYYDAFDNFDAEKVSVYSDSKIELLLQNPEIIRNRLKTQSIVKNSQAFLQMNASSTNFSDFIWSFTDHKIVQNNWKTLQQVPSSTEESVKMSKALKKAGFKFVGPTICYAFMQACGMVNDHITDCYRHKELL